MAEHNEFGSKAEEMACKYLEKKGYKILERNFFYNKAEVDVIAAKDNFIIGIEVKARSTSFFGNPQEFITKKKIGLLVKVMNEYVIRNNIDKEVRFDIIGIVKSKQDFAIEHVENAFYHF